jgi:hypothetical protein
VLDEYLAGELGAEASERASAHLASCDHCAGRRAAREADQRAFLEAAPTFEAHASRVQRVHGTASGPRRRTVIAAASVLALAAAALLIVRAPRQDGETRSKGGVRIGFYVKRGEQVTRGSAGQAVRAGDALRFVYSAPGDAYLALFNLDARGAAVYFPDRSASAASVRKGSEVPLDFSVRLDDSPGVEQVHALFCPGPFPIEPLRAELQAQKRLVAPEGCTHHVIALQKEVP